MAQQQNHRLRTNNSRIHTILFLIFPVAEEVKTIVFTVVIKPLGTRYIRRTLQFIIRFGKIYLDLIGFKYNRQMQAQKTWFVSMTESA